MSLHLGVGTYFGSPMKVKCFYFVGGCLYDWDMVRSPRPGWLTDALIAGPKRGWRW